MTKKESQNCAKCLGTEMRVVPAPQTPARPADFLFSAFLSDYIISYFWAFVKGFCKNFSKKFSTGFVKKPVENLWIIGDYIRNIRLPLPPHILLVFRRRMRHRNNKLHSIHGIQCIYDPLRKRVHIQF
jgi:hypothetical protein